MAFDIAKALGGIQPAINTRRLEKIELHMIDKNPKNLYSMDGIEALADNIATVGLMEPLIVRMTPQGRYMLISGHRRRAALCRLADDGRLKDGWHHKVPCMVEPDDGLILPGCPEEGEEAEEARRLAEELKLLFANSDTRELSSSDKAMQVRQLREVLSRLRDLGADLPGRMRDHVAAAAKVSPTRVARLDVIDKGLKDPRLRKAWEAGKLSETSAYEIARQEDEAQKILTDREVEYLCTATSEEVSAIMAGASADVREIQETQLPETEFSADSYLAQRANEDKMYAEMLEHVAGRFLRELDGVRSRQDGIETLKKIFRHSGLYGCDVEYEGSPKGLTLTKKRTPAILRTWTEVYDLLSLIALRRAGQKVSGADTDEDEEEDEDEIEGEEDWMVPGEGIPILSAAWQTGDPVDDGRYFCRVLIGEDERPHEQRMEWKAGGWRVFGDPADKYQMQVVAWWPLPPEV